MSCSSPVIPTQRVSLSNRRKMTCKQTFLKQAVDLSKPLKLKNYIKILMLTAMLRNYESQALDFVTKQTQKSTRIQKSSGIQE